MKLYPLQNQDSVLSTIAELTEDSERGNHTNRHHIKEAMSRSSAKEMKSSTEVVTTPIRFLTKEDLVSLLLSLHSPVLKITFEQLFFVQSLQCILVDSRIVLNYLSASIKAIATSVNIDIDILHFFTTQSSF